MNQPKKFKLSAKQRKLLKILRQRQGINAKSSQVIPRREEGKAIPLSFAQEWMWLLEEFASPAYNRAFALQIKGRLDPSALEQSLNEIIRRHESLRTTFPRSDGKLTQVIAPKLTLALPVIDLQHLTQTERVAEAIQLAKEKTKQPFNLDTGSLVRAYLLRLGEQEHILLLTLHHIIYDYKSLRILLSEIAALYDAFSAGKRSPLTELPIQYADFACWQRQSLNKELLDHQLAYWKQQLDGRPPLLNLPTDHGRSAVSSLTNSSQSWQISQELTQELKALSQQEGVTLFMTILAAFSVLLYRYTGQQDILIGSPIEGRNRVETEELIGVFINNLVLRINLVENPSFRELLPRVKQVVLGAYDNQDLPFAKLVQELQPERDLGENSLFQVMLNFRNSLSEVVEDFSLDANLLELDMGMSKLDLVLIIENSSSGIQGKWEYNSDLFDAATITRMGWHFQTLLEGIVANPQQRVSELPILTKAEEHQLLVEWNDTEVEYPREKCIHQLFEEQVEKTPDAIALVFEEQQLTYRELNEKANQLAHYLQGLGIKSDDLVGICLDRSLEMVMGILGILKAGGAYVPLDPDYPNEHLEYVVSDSRLKLLLTNKKYSDKFHSPPIRTIFWDQDWSKIVSCNSSNPVPDTTAENLAYVIYTSGSTGNPKGVLIAHQNVTRLFAATQSCYNFNDQDVWALFHSYAFDFAVWEMWGALLHGGRLVIVPYWISRTPESFYNLLHQERVTILNQTPSAFFQLMKVDENFISSRQLSLRLVIFGGEKLNFANLKPWFDRHGDKSPQLVNMYGITETTVHVTYHKINARDVNCAKSLIGRPIPDLQVYLLDENLQQVPIGIAGEMYVGGAGIAQGYLDRAELTTQKFIANPFFKKPKARLYKTGDFARRLSDGNLEYLGRIDNQVKIRGFRIELGEIESALNSHAQINQAVVVAKEDDSGDKRLVAYIVKSAKAIANREIRQFVQQKLPGYMIPSTLVELEQLPITPNGKVDRLALEKLEVEFARENEYVAPRNPREAILAEIFADVLNLEQVGVKDNFFELGGHSLLATQLLFKLKNALSIELSLSTVFSNPTVASLNQKVTELEANSTSVLPSVVSLSGNYDQFPLSQTQERLWLIDQIEESQSPVYNIPIAWHLEGNLNLTALQQALNEIISRHEVLRTSFQSFDGEPQQVIYPEVELPLKITNLSELNAADREASLQQALQQEINTPFNLTTEFLIRSNVWQLSSNEYVFLINIHHIVADGWSMKILQQELSALYPALVAGKTSPLPELELQYGDYVLWQRKLIQGEEILSNQLNYWQRQLNSAPELLNLPLDQPRPSIQTFQGKTVNFSLSEPLSQDLQILAHQSGTTLFMTLLAGFALLLNRFCSQSDILIGSPIANRNRSEIANLIGYFANTIVLRTNFADNPSFTSLLQQVKETTLQAYENQDVGFEQIVEILNPERSPSYSPLFQVAFALQNTQRDQLSLAGVNVQPLELEKATAKFDLTLRVKETSSGLIGYWNYNTDLFNPETISRMAGHFQTLLEAIVANPEQKISKLPILTDQEKYQLLVAWNNTERDYPRDKCIHQLFEEQVERTPDAVALVLEKQQLTYKELNERANQLAHYLRSLGVKPDDLVGICLDRSLEMIIGIIGILKSGGAYVPLDPKYPQERLAYMFSDARLKLLLTTEKENSQLPSHQAQTIFWDQDLSKITLASNSNPVNNATAENLAYVIYTSGSTGRPKGVQIAHRGLCNLAKSQVETLDMRPESRMLQFASINFDASIWEIVIALTSGARLCLGTSESLLPGNNLCKLLKQQKVTHMLLPPSALAVMPQKKLPALEVLVVGGEAISTDLVQQWSNQVRLFNAYGPTECTVCATIFEFESLNNKLLIGRPLPNTEVYILDDYGQPVPVGVPGELHIGGVGLARGYLNQPKLTQEKFIANPFFNEDKGSVNSPRLYKTGDLARYLIDGKIEFLGRIDNQVKIRGFRIELGEIEAVLNSHTQINQAVVVAKEDDSRNKRLVAYVVKSAEAIANKEIRQFVQQKLPGYMIPSALVELEQLPITPNGKVDRLALEKLEVEFARENEYVAPRNPREAILANIFADVLNLEQVGVKDNFFDLGGHSLLATQLMARVGRFFSKKLSVASLWENPTVEQLARQIDLTSQQDIAPIVPVARQTDLPLSFAQERLWFLAQLQGDSPGVYNIPFALCLKGILDVEALSASLREIIQRHEILRTKFSLIDGVPRQIISSFPDFIQEFAPLLKITDISDLPEPQKAQEAQKILQQGAQQSFDLATGSLLQFQLVKLLPEKHYLLLTMHHVVFDGWSQAIFCKELQAIYTALLDKSPLNLEKLPLQYGDFAVWQRQYLQGEVLATQLNYWRKQLANCPPLLKLPTDYERPGVQTYNGDRHSLKLSPELSQALKERSRQSGATLFMTLLASFKVLLFLYTNQKDIVVGSPVANRNQAEVEGLIGFFVNTLVLRTEIKGELSFVEILGRVREVALGAYAHQDLPLSKLVEELQPARNQSYSPLFQVMFALQNTATSELKLPGLELQPLQLEKTVSKFDLTLSLRETPEGVQGSWIYNTDLFKDSTIERLSEHFQGLLKDIIQHPERSVASFSLTTKAEQQQSIATNKIVGKIAQLSPAKRAILEQKLRSKSRRQQTSPRAKNSLISLSFSQQNLWLLDQLEPGNPVYNRPTNICLKGRLNQIALQNSLNEIVRRHEILRTSIVSQDGQPFQQIASTLTIELPVVDISSLPLAQRNTEAQRIAAKLANFKFDLAQLPLLKATLVRLSAQEHILLLNLHHIVFDGWSMGVLMRELLVIYEAFDASTTPALPELPLQYADFAIAQHDQLKGEKLQSQLSFWREQLKGDLPVLELPTDRPRVKVATFRGAKQSHQLPTSLGEALKVIGKQEQTTLFMILLAAFKVLLLRYTEQEDIIIGCPTAARNSAATEQLIGLFINTLVLRTNVEHTLTFKELLNRVRQQTLAAYSHQDVPLPKLVEELQLTRDLSHSSLFQVLFQLRNLPTQELATKELSFENFEFDRGLALLDLSLDIVEQPSGLSLTFEYNQDLFDAATIRRMAGHFQTLLESIVANPDEAIANLTILTPTERHNLLNGFSGINQISLNTPSKAQSIHELFEEQVERSPDAIAVISDAGQLTYGELNQKANQLARYLQTLGVKAEVLVGILLERSLETIIGMLAVLKAGGAYVPLDPNYPGDRLNLILEDAQISVLLTQQSLKPLLQDYAGHSVYLDATLAEIFQQPNSNLPHSVNSENLAYLIYTSGTTGTPKGVCIEHHSLVNFTRAAISEYELSPQDRVLQFASLGFDAAVEEIYPCLVKGGTLVLRNDAMVSEVSRFLEACRDWRITVLDLPTAYWQQMVSALESSRLKLPDCLRLVIIGGERVAPEYVQKWLQYIGDVPKLVNSYGPTECTVVSTLHNIKSTDINTKGEIPIGSAIEGAQTYILDRKLQPVPIGIAGELFIGGVGVARGYLNRPELTSEKFIAHPFDNSKSARLYRTGDLARYLPNGTIEFLGRIDNQVKIRGFRIELGEVETVLRQHHDAKDAVVVAHDFAPGDQRLLAYVVSSDLLELDRQELRRFLQQKLPEYMIPSLILSLQDIPLNSNGKVDYSSLPVPDLNQLERAQIFVAPRTPVEEQLAEIWCEVLQVEKVGIHDNFFELGGHSLLAIKLISRISQKLQGGITLRSLFEAPTIAELGTQIVTSSPNNLVSLSSVPRSENIPLSFAQQRLWFLDQLEENSPAYNMSLVVRLRGQLNVSALEEAIREIIQRHEILRVNFASINGSPVQIINASGSFELRLVELLGGTGRLEESLKAERRQPFDLAKDSLIRAKLFRLNDQEHVLVITLHHIIFDGWSMGILSRELSVLYSAFCQNNPSPLAKLPVQYADFATQQQEQFAKQVWQNQLDYWRKKLSGAPPLLKLPTDYPRPAIQSFTGKREFRLLSSSLSKSLAVLSKKSGVTLFMTLLATFKILLARWSGSADILVGSPLAGRNRLEIEPLIGLFLKTVVLRTKLADNPSFLELLGRVKEVTLGAFEHQDIPFEKLVEELQPERSLGYTPIFQVLFNMTNMGQSSLELPGLNIEPISSKSDAPAKFDLTLYVKETKSGIKLDLVYNAELFTSSRMVQMLEQLEYLLTQIVAEPERAIADLSLVTPQAESILPNPRHILPQVRYELVTKLFDTWVHSSPEHPAVSQGGRQWTYGQLSAKAYAVAEELLKSGLKPGEVVAVSGDRSFGLIVSMLAVFLSGGVLLTLAQNLPQKRRQLMLEAAKATKGLFVGHYSPEVEGFPESIELLEIDSDSGEIKGITPQNRDDKAIHLPDILPEDAAYIFFTSGTTGIPKGVRGTHQGIAHFLDWQRQTFAIEPTDRCAQLTGLSFDVVLRDIFLPLTSGATLVLPNADDTLDGDCVLSWLSREQISVVHTVPTLARTWLKNSTTEVSLATLRWIFFAGEPLTKSLVTLWRETFPSSGTIVNLYGPTETTLAKCFYIVPEEMNSEIQPIGVPLPETQALVLSKNKQMCGIGESGEIVLRTPFRTKGYINAPEENRQRFVPNPFRNDQEDLLYYTGDMGRYGIDASLEILGRIDNQVKIRGIRIEPEAVSQILLQHSGVKEALVISREDQFGEKCLVAYVIAAQETKLTTSSLRQFVKQQLPDYIVLAAIVMLDRLPLTPNGKVDHRALPVPNWSQPMETESFVAPSTPNEQCLAEIWREILQVEKVGIHDNFFALGGHSLLATQIISRIREIEAIELPLRILFEFPTVAELALAIERQQDTTDVTPELPEISPLDRRKRQIKRSSL